MASAGFSEDAQTEVTGDNAYKFENFLSREKDVNEIAELEAEAKALGLNHTNRNDYYKGLDLGTIDKADTYAQYLSKEIKTAQDSASADAFEYLQGNIAENKTKAEVQARYKAVMKTERDLPTPLTYSIKPEQMESTDKGYSMDFGDLLNINDTEEAMKTAGVAGTVVSAILGFLGTGGNIFAASAAALATGVAANEITKATGALGVLNFTTATNLPSVMMEHTRDLAGNFFMDDGNLYYSDGSSWFSANKAS